MKRLAFALACILGLWLVDGHDSASAKQPSIDLSAREKGKSTGLPIPRFVSLKADVVNVRRGPGWDHAIAWVFRRAGLPVEIIAEFDVWRKVRDSEGATGWVIGTLLSGRRTVLVAPWENKQRVINMHNSASGTSSINAKLSPGVLGNVDNCDGDWCEIRVGGAEGYISQELVWGAYPGETIE